MFGMIPDLDTEATLASAGAARRAADRAEAEQLALAVHWAHLHGVLPPRAVRGSTGGGEQLVDLAGEGTPPVAEFAPGELGAVLRITTFAANALVGEGLELQHRLPQTWGRVVKGSLQAWRARRIARQTICLSREAAAWVDAHISGVAHKVGLKRTLELVAAALWTFDPEEAARRAEAARETRRVTVGREVVDGNRSVHIQADALAVANFDAILTVLAKALAAEGDEDILDVRRARAVGLLADPEKVLALLDAKQGVPAKTSADAPPEADDPRPGADDAHSEADDPHPEPADATPEPARRRGARPGKPVLYIHLHAEAVVRHGDAAMARAEGVGPVSVGQVVEWLGQGAMKIQPVIDLAQSRSVDAYEAPDDVRETVLLRQPCCPFPWCDNLGREKDMDHIDEYVRPEDGGGPGQTQPDKLAGMCRRHHRFKTHGAWSYTVPEPGLYLWRSPHGRRFLVDNTGTAPLSDTG